jgi:ribonuclease D
LTTGPTRLISSLEEFAGLIDAWRSEPVIGIDTEAASFHRFRDRVYLLQLSTERDTVVVDPLATGGIGALQPWFQSETEFVFHDADYDLRLMHREAGLRLRRLFDTRVAAQFLNLPGIGLGAILEARFGISTNKRFQRADWSARPLSEDMIAYAATDTRFLASLREAFRVELEALGRLAWVEEECRLLTSVEWPPQEPPENTFLRIKGARDLDRRGLAILRELHVWREGHAARLDRALFRVMGNEALVKLASLRPQTGDELGRIRGVGAENASRRGEEILAAIARGLAVPDAELPRFERQQRRRPDPAFERRVERLKAWRTPAAARYDLPPGLIAPNGSLEALARAAPTTLEELEVVPGIRRWQVGEFGAELLEALQAAN